MKITNWETSTPQRGRTHYVHEFIGADGSLPPDLAGKSLDDVAFYVNDPAPRTLTADTAAPIARGDLITHEGSQFKIDSIETIPGGRRFIATEVIAIEIPATSVPITAAAPWPTTTTLQIGAPAPTAPT